MRKLGLGILVAVTVLVISGIVMAAPWGKGAEMAEENVSDVALDNAGMHAVFLRGGLEIGLLKGILDVRHEFPNGFTANVTPVQLSLLNFLGIDTEPVQLYHILPPNKCGDGTCQGFESPETCPEDCGITECSPDNQRPWGIMKVNGGSGGSGITVAVLDTGVDQDHPDIVNNIVACIAFGYTTCEDGHGHGTHVSGTVLANGKIIGVAPGASLMVVKVCSNAGDCWGDDIAAGIIYAADNGANIISMSFGGGSMSTVEKEAIDHAVEKDVLLVAAAGNSGPGEDTMGYPAAYYQIMGVAAIDSNEDVASFSSRGLSNGDNVVDERELDVAAPGVSVESTFNDGCYKVWSGTSMATPHVAGLAAKLWQGTATETREYLDYIVIKDLYDPGHDIYTGFGLPIAPACSSDVDCEEGAICCSGQCIVPVCSANTDCDDAEACTTDTCNYGGTCDASCSNTWPACDLSVSDGCCGPECTSETDIDCPEEDPCLNCFKGVCDGKCHPAKEDAACPDCW